jgi:hypothetical protein
MYLSTTLSDGTSAKIIVRHGTVERLATTCFRGTDRARAGNFSRFARVQDVFRDKKVLDGLRKYVSESVHELLDSPDFLDATFSCTVDAGHPVGWESTDRMDRYSAELLEPFNPNRRSRALRIKPDRTDIRAPVTSLVTLVFQLRYEVDAWAIVIHSMYPGKDIGDLVGDITRREQRVFFVWEHHGA